MELVYTNQLDGFEPGKRYRVPGLFRSIERDATAVTVVGDYPEIVTAYEDAGVDVVVALPEPVFVGTQAIASVELSKLLADLQGESDAMVLLVDGLEAGEIHRPEAGALALRLFEVLGTIHASVGELTTERDGLDLTVDTLREEIEALKKASITPLPDEVGEIAALKAKLDEAKVQYRANASKESLEKLVAELAKT
ncbi:hypothetical protein GIV23_18560 [Pseudomonas sp. PA-1-2A]|uniref:hypothetical protein n=1 Tax=Pseudomonas TaxID=286 RepID=UPI0014731860|nr:MULTISPECIES: hypothetical protein [Pseudomonas]MCF5691149.1 hypothetical protein [Pseudomonas sp. PA-1-8C]MCF5788735.1 hypothetical protein [Pseudomonas sp. PA-1-6G]MCF5791549.1 hypothetical protein [Pseudomonas sp. PA-1-6B]MCF5797660.1 hypothetical protein [Pseudomonas sp. PA-1-5A]MCF5815311.1 hypothetical protein [Pseudomonas sp. PA-1-2A]